jgi:hypothetical protein
VSSSLGATSAGPPPSAAGALSVPAYPPPSAADAALPPDDAPLSSEHRTRCLFGGFCFGPTLTLGLLDVFGVGVQGRSDYWGVAIDYQFFHFTTQGVAVGLSLLTVEGRAFPFGNAFFLSAGVAWQRANLSRHVSYAGDSNVPPIEADLSGRINVPVLKLGLGFMGRSGFSVGIDLAVGVQLGANTVEFSSTLPQIQQVVNVQNKIRNRADKFVRSLPFLLQANLVRIGFLF